jgi:hypothetical protein
VATRRLHGGGSLVGRCGHEVREREESDNGTPFIGDMARSGGRPAGGATQRRGVGEGCGADMAVGRRGVAGSNPAAARVGGARARGAQPTSKQGRGDADERAPAQ